MTSITLVANGSRTVDNETTIPRTWITDGDITLDAKGFLAYLATLPAGPHSLDFIAGQHAYDSRLLMVIANELEWAGYITITGGDL